VSNLERSGGRLGEFGHLAVAGVQRSAFLTAGFCDMIQARNPFCALPIIRLELDTAMRMHAAWMVSDMRGLLRSIEDDSLRNMKDVDGKKLTDERLHTELARSFPCASRLYRVTSGEVHLSTLAMRHAFEGTAGGFSIELAPCGVDEGWEGGEVCSTVIDYAVALRMVMALAIALMGADVAESLDPGSVPVPLAREAICDAEKLVRVELPTCPEGRTFGTQGVDGS